MIAIACDHAGIDLKPAVIEVLDELGLSYKDLGTYSHESVDYPVYGAKAAKAASLEVAQLGTERKNEALRAMAKALVEKTPEILAANEKDMTKGRESGMPESLLDRLMLNADRIAGMAEGLDQVAALPDPAAGPGDDLVLAKD